jgi:ribosomal-protein-alanine N-acetyltransferase
MTLPITTGRLVLRRFTYADVPDMLDCLSDPRFACATPEITATEAGVRAYVDMQNGYKPFELDRCFDLAIERKEDGRVLGLLSLVRKAHGQAEIGYALGRAHRGQGYAIEAAQALLAYAFTALGLHRVQATTRPANRGSWQVMERLGMRREGWLREAAYSDGVWEDTLIYGILAGEAKRSEDP